MIFRQDGSVRTTNGWTFHELSNEGKQSPQRVRLRARASADVLVAISDTADRHAHNTALKQIDLTSEDWHALFRALIEAESAYHPHAISPKGAYGLGQLMPATARDLGVDRTDIAENLDGSARYLLAQLAAFRDIDLALAAYNAGPHRVIEYGGVPPFKETQTYIARVHHIRARLSNTAARTRTNGSASADTRSEVVLGQHPVGSPRPTHSTEPKSHAFAAMPPERP